MKVLFVGMVVAAITGCGKGESGDDQEWQQFVSRYADNYCDLRHQCDANFDNEFGNEDQCKKEVLTNENKGRQCRKDQDCEFDPDEGSFCLSAAAEVDCAGWRGGELESKCADIWSCDMPYEACED